MTKSKNYSQLVIILSTVSFILIVIEAMMTDTILGNVIILALAFGLSFTASATSVTELIHDKNTKNIILSVSSTLILIYIIFMFVTGNVPAGYGP